MSTTPSRNDPCPCGSGRKYKHCCLRRDRAEAARGAERPGLARAAAEHRWEAGIFPLPVRIGDRPDRRVTISLVAAGGLVLHHDLSTEPLSSASDVVDALEAALDAVEEETGVEPQRVAVRHREEALGLAVRLAARGAEVIHARRLAHLEDAARSLARSMAGLDGLPVSASAPTWRGWGLSGRQCRALFRAAARFRRAAPWEWLDDDPIRVFGPWGMWVAAVMGCGGEEFGLALYTEPGDYELLSRSPDPEDGLSRMEGAVVSLSFQDRSELSREMQREVASAGWEVADPGGYPLVIASNTPAGGLDPALVDRLTGLLLAVPDFLEECGDELEEALAGEVIVWSHEGTGLRLRLTVPGGFQWPVPERLSPGGPEGPGAEPAAIHGPFRTPDEWEDEWNEERQDEGRDGSEPDSALVDAFEARLCESVTAATAARHARNARELSEFMNGEQGAPLRALHEFDLRIFLYAEYPRTNPSFTAAESLPGSLRKLFAFLAEERGVNLPWAEPILADTDTFRRRVHGAPSGAWWDDDVRNFRADVWGDLERRVMALPVDWAGALEPQAMTGFRESVLQREAQRRWLVWRDEAIRRGTDEPEELDGVLEARLLDWLEEPEPGDGEGRSRLAVIRAERASTPEERRREMERMWFGEE